MSENGFEYKAISAAGTIVLRARATVLHIIIPEVSTGTVTFYDSATAAGTSATNRIFSVPGGTAVQDCFPRILDVQCKTGLTYAATGTPTATVAIL